MSVPSRGAVTVLVAVVIVIATLAAVPASAENQVAVTFYRDVLPIIQDNCQGCHRSAGLNISGLVAPMSFMTFEETRPWARAIARKVEAREMPPWFASAPTGVFKNERGLANHEIDTILSWVNEGAPAGNRADAPPSRLFAEEANDGWSHGTPDVVITLAEPYAVPDDAYDITAVIPVRLTEDLLPENVWVRGWELRTGSNRIGGVHHMCVHQRSEDGKTFSARTATAEEAAVDLRPIGCVAEGADMEDLEAWEEMAGVTVRPGDAVFVRTGRWARRADVGPWDLSESAAGLHASVMPWFKARDVSFLGGDGASDVSPAGVDGVSLPVHLLAIVAMGVDLFDNQDLEALAETAAELNRWEFMFVAAPLAVENGTGSPINALAIF